MQSRSRGMQAKMNSLQDFQHQKISPSTHFDPNSHDDFLDQMFSTLPSSSWHSPWELNPSALKPGDLPDDTTPSNGGYHLDDSAILASKLRQHQISSASTVATAKLMLQSGILPINDIANNQRGEANSVQALYNGFGGPNQPQHFNHPQAQSYGGQGTAPNQEPAASGSMGSSPAQPRQKVRARRGQATDPHSIAERLRRERIAERMKALQELVPNVNKTDKASMLDEIIDYVKFLQLQVKVLSMSRLGGAGAVAPLVADISSEGGGGDGIQSNGNQTPSCNDTLTVTEHQVAKLMEEDMGSAMQYLQGKGLCLMPISLATAISTATCHSRNPTMAHPLHGEGPSSSSMSALTVQSTTVGYNGASDGSVKDATSFSMP